MKNEAGKKALLRRKKGKFGAKKNRFADSSHFL
jgi:hypothetical protein